MVEMEWMAPRMRCRLRYIMGRRFGRRARLVPPVTPKMAIILGGWGGISIRDFLMIYALEKGFEVMYYENFQLGINS
jgi:hypothetical protein